MLTRRIRWIAAMLLPAVTGCYTYSPLARPAPQAGGERVRAELTPLASAQLDQYLGSGVDWLEGTIVAADNDSVTLAVAMTSGRKGEDYWNGEQAKLPLSAIATMQQRELSKPKTFLASAGIVAGALLLARLFQGGDAQGGIRVPDNTAK